MTPSAAVVAVVAAVVAVAVVVVAVAVVAASSEGQLPQSTKHTFATVHPGMVVIASLHSMPSSAQGTGGSALPLQLTAKSSIVLVDVLVLVAVLVDVLVLVDVTEVVVVAVVAVRVVVLVPVPVVVVVADVVVVMVVAVAVVVDVVSGHRLPQSSGHRSSTSTTGWPGAVTSA